jgi:hypothetical protein
MMTFFDRFLERPLSPVSNKYTQRRMMQSDLTALSSSSTPTKRAPLGRFYKNLQSFHNENTESTLPHYAYHWLFGIAITYKNN